MTVMIALAQLTKMKGTVVRVCVLTTYTQENGTDGQHILCLFGNSA